LLEDGQCVAGRERHHSDKLSCPFCGKGGAVPAFGEQSVLFGPSGIFVNALVVARIVEVDEEAEGAFGASGDVMPLHAASLAAESADGTNGLKM